MKRYKRKLNQNPEHPVYWCDTCNLVLLNNTCDTCRETGRRLELSPPADIRLASAFEKNLLNRMLTTIYGCSVERELILLNKTGGADKTDEIIVDGHRFGTLYFDVATREYRVKLDGYGAALLLQKAERQIVRIKPQHRHVKGKSLPPEEILEAIAIVDDEQDVLVSDGRTLQAAGRIQRGEGGDIRQLRIKKINTQQVNTDLKNPSLQELLEANRTHMKKITLNALNVIRGTLHQRKHRQKPVYVSFSGGKDSLVCMDLARRASKKVKAFFVNTGIEFPETTAYIKDYCNKNNTPLIEINAGNAFWNNVKSFGPPGKDYRWCCKLCKLAPINQLTENQNIITIDGKRRYESFTRSKIPSVEENPLIPNQTNIYPIRNWRALEVWLYIHYKKLEYNPLYDEGFERVGCYLCPAALQAEYHRLNELHPELHNQWEEYLHQWAEEQGLPREYIELGFWRWKQHPPKMVELAKQHNITINPQHLPQKDEFSITIASGLSPCTTGGYSIEGTIRGMPAHETRRILNILGDFQYVSELGVNMLKLQDSSIKIFDSGNLVINAPTETKAHTLLDTLKKQLTRLAKCTECKLCTHTCPQKAITLPLQISAECTHCNKCTKTCPITRYD
jgi:phosphoadenosine phosphosulfate reductase